MGARFRVYFKILLLNIEPSLLSRIHIKVPAHEQEEHGVCLAIDKQAKEIFFFSS